MEDFKSKYTGEQVEQLLDKVASGGTGGGGDTTAETDPIFSASPAASITEEKKAEWDEKYTKPNGGIPASDLASDVFLQGEKGDKGDKGDQGEQGPKGDDGVDGEDGATFTPSVDANGNLSWTNDKGLSNPPTVNIKGPKGDSGEGGGVSVITQTSSEIEALQPNVITIITDPLSGLYINDFVISSSNHDEYTIVFSTSAEEPGVPRLTLPDYVLWANGSIPTFEWSTVYEFSITRDSLIVEQEGTTVEQNVYKAVLTPFKSVG